MKNNPGIIVFILSFMIMAIDVNGQELMEGVDSVPMLKPKMSSSICLFEDNGARSISIEDIEQEFVKYKPKTFLRDLGNGALTAITGIGFSTTTEGNWKISGTIRCNDSLGDWNINMFCEGYIEKNRERVRDSDGSWSVETYESKVFYWDRDATGLIIENSDTIGYFLIIMNPREDSLMKPMADYILPDRTVVEDVRPKFRVMVSWKPAPGNDYGIIGKFCGKDFYIIRNGTDRKAWISIDNVLVSKFQSDLDYPGLSKKYRIQPYLLINTTIPGQDRRDLFRLAMLSRFLNYYLN
jgi:hypothetical protein